MSAPIKVFLGGAAVAGLGGTGIWLLYKEGAPDRRTLDQDSDFSGTTDPYKDKYAADHARFLVGVEAAKDDAKPESNRDWWEWSFKNRYRPEEAKAGFKDVKKGSKESAGDGPSLQEKCASAYKADKTNVTNDATDTDATDTDANKYKEDQVWLYCGVSSTKPKSLGEMTNEQDQDKKNLGDGKVWGGSRLGSAKKQDLLAIHAPSNKEVWDHLDRRFEREKSGASKFFANTSNGATIRDRCAQAYMAESTSANDEDTKPKEDALYKWCSLKGKTTAGG